MPDYFELPLTEEIGAGQLQHQRTRALVVAIDRNRDTNLVQLLKSTVPDIQRDIIVFDIKCNGIPPKNEPGLRFRERLALIVDEDPKKLIEVQALRKDFPILIHQNQTAPDTPASLCLYAEPSSAVFRAWTPERFLQRIQWWLESSAAGKLHGPQQAVEHLFYRIGNEIVLPWDFDALRQNPQKRFAIAYSPKRKDGHMTFHLQSFDVGNNPQNSVSPTELTVTPVIHGYLVREPFTLGQLSDYLQERGTDFFGQFRNAITESVGDQGALMNNADPFSLILLYVPVIREEDGPVERTDVRAYVLVESMLEIGLQMGALFRSPQDQNRVFRETMALGQVVNDSWRAIPVEPLDVLRCNDRKMAMAQSGISDEGPNGVLIGVGSLGSLMLNFWGRSGWGTWQVVDKDHVKPHNITRHMTYASSIGYSKVQAVANLYDGITGGWAKLGTFETDAYEMQDQNLIEALSNSSLAVDASTTLEYPRLISERDDFCRHVSTFITPNGNSAVLMIEDGARTIRLRTLEAQYYRAVITESWGSDHLDGNLGQYYSGAGCRDISLVLPYSRVANHAATLAEHVRLASLQNNALIRVWERNPDTGAVTAYTVQTAQELACELRGLVAYYDEGLVVKVRAMRQQVVPNETGGVLVGYYDFNRNIAVIVDALPAPPDSISTPTSFQRGTEGLAEKMKEISKRTAGVVGYIGEWHSHPPGHGVQPSRDDIEQLIFLSLGMSADGIPALSMIVGENDINVIQGQVL